MNEREKGKEELKTFWKWTKSREGIKIIAIRLVETFLFMSQVFFKLTVLMILVDLITIRKIETIYLWSGFINIMSIIGATVWMVCTKNYFVSVSLFPKAKVTKQ